MKVKPLSFGRGHEEGYYIGSRVHEGNRAAAAFRHVNQAIVHFYQNGFGEELADNYKTKFAGRLNEDLPKNGALEDSGVLVKIGEKAECRGANPNTFFPERGAEVKTAKAICKKCVVREDCLEYALCTKEKKGIWGGASERQRRRMLIQRQLMAANPAEAEESKAS